MNVSGRRMDMRAPADPQDFETTLSRSASPPREFQVTGNSSLRTITVTDVVTVRGATKFFRVSFLRSNAVDLTTAERRSAAYRMSAPVAILSSTGNGEKMTYQDSANPYAGYYFCVGVNDRGEESNVEHVVKAPV